MAETTADVRRDIELTRERMSSTIDQLERKLNVAQMVREHPWPALALAVGAGVLLSGSRADVKSAAATLLATKGAGSRLGAALDDVVASVVGAAHDALQGQVDRLVGDVKSMIGAPRGSHTERSFGVGPVDMVPQRGPAGVSDIERAD